MPSLPQIFAESPGLQLKSNWLSDEVYPQALDSMIVVCTDAVIINNDRETFWLVKRCAKPMQGWWWIGGRVQRGERFEDAIVRNFKRETGLEIAAERFRYVKLIRYWWKDRQQPPQEAGTDVLVFTFSVDLADAELASIVLDQIEYESGSLTEFTGKQLGGVEIHPVIRDVYNAVFPTR